MAKLDSGDVGVTVNVADKSGESEGGTVAVGVLDEVGVSLKKRAVGVGEGVLVSVSSFSAKRVDVTVGVPVSVSVGVAVANSSA